MPRMNADRRPVRFSRRALTSVRTMIMLSLVITACSFPGLRDDPQVYEGFVIFGFEVSAFQPCGVEETWWVHGDREGEALDALFDAYNTATGYPQEQYQPVYVRVAGEIGPEGSYGHLGAYQREFTLTRFLEMDPSRETCP